MAARKQRQSKTSKRRLKTRLRESDALRLRMSGMQYKDIGTKLGISAQAAHAQVKKLLDGLEVETKKNARDLRKLMLARLDAMLEGLWAKAEKGDARAVDRVLKLEIRRAKMLGLDAPQRREFTGAGGEPLIPDRPPDLTKLTTEQLRQWRELLAATNATPEG